MRTTAALSRKNPFPGLRPFKEEEEYLFFGREDQVDSMVNKLGETRFLGVLGTSGCGKSSLVNCGLRPALHQGLLTAAGTNWRMAQFRPGSAPLAALARALAKDGVLFDGFEAEGLDAAEIVETSLRMSKVGLVDIVQQAKLPASANVLVVVDQFEELFRYRALEQAQHAQADEISAESTAFVNLLLEAVKQAEVPIYVVLTMRSDFLGDCTLFRGLAEAINAGQYLVPRMTREERRRAISGPVGVAGAEIAPVLLTRLVNDVGDNPDQLSILQHALNRTWAAWEEAGAEGPLDLPHYKAIGTMAEALDRHAEQARAALPGERHKQVCERIFKALTDKATDPRGVRRPTTLGTLCALAEATPDEVAEVIDVFRDPSRSFLMPPAGEALTPETVVDISHESLMRIWKQLNAWANEEAASARMYQRLAETAALHAKGEAGLWQDVDLQQALRWRAANKPNEVWAKRYAPGFDTAMSFVDTSTRVATSRRRRRIGSWIAAAVLLVGVAVALVTMAEEGKAQARRYETDAREKEALALRELGRREMLNGSAPKALLYLTKALERLPNDEATRFLIARGVAVMDRTVAVLQGHTQRLRRAVFNHDGTKVVTASKDGTARIFDAATGMSLHTLDAGKGEVNAAAFSRDGRFVVTASDDGTARIFDADTGAEQRVLRAHQEPDTSGTDFALTVATFNAAGTRVVTAGRDMTARVWDAESGRPVAQFVGHFGQINAAAFSPDGEQVVTAGEDKSACVWFAESGELVTRLTGHTKRINAVSFSPDGRLVVTAGDDPFAIISPWKPATIDSTPVLLVGHEGKLYSAAFNQDGSKVVTASSDRTARIWRVQDATLLRRLGDHERGVLSARFSPDGASVVTACEDGFARAFDVKTGERQAKLQGHTATVYEAAFSPDAQRIVTASEDATARIFSLSESRADVLGGEDKTRIYSAACSEDGSRLVLGGRDGARIIEARSGKQVATLHADLGYVYSVAFSPDGQRVVAGFKEDAAQVFDVATGAPVGTPIAHSGWVRPVQVNAGGTRVLTGARDGFIRLWDDRDGRVATVGSQRTTWIHRMAFSPDGRCVWIANTDGSVQIFDAGSGAPTQKIRAHQGAVACLAFGKDGRRAVTAGADGSARIYDVATDRVMPIALSGHSGPLFCAAFDAQGDRVVTGSFDLTARIFDAATAEALATLEGNESSVLWATFSPDGRLVATAGHDKTVRIFDARTGDTLAIFRGHTGPVSWVAFAADGARLFSHSWDWNANPPTGDGSVRLWNIRDERSLEEIRADVAARVPYAMTKEGVIVARPPGQTAK